MFYSYFESLCAKKGVTVNKACKEMGVSRSVAAKWKSTNTEPSAGTMIKISSYFNVPFEEVISHSKRSANASLKELKKESPDVIPNIEAKSKLQIISELSGGLDEDQQDAIISLLSTLVQHQ